MRLYLDTNVYAHVEECSSEKALAEWLSAGNHHVVLSEVHLGEAIAIKDPAHRDARLRLLASLPWRRTDPLAYLQTREFVNEVRRIRPGWRRLPVGDVSLANALLDSHADGWRLLSRDPARLVDRTGIYRQVEEQAISHSRAGQKLLRGQLQAGSTRTRELVIDGEHVPVRQLDFVTDDDFCRFESLAAWHQALVHRALTLSDLTNYADPYVDMRRVGVSDYVSFWVDDVDLRRLPRGYASSLVISGQRRAQIGHGNAADARHAGYAVDAALFITEDENFHDALQLIAAQVPGAAQFRLIRRADPDVIEQLSAAVMSITR